MIIATIVILLFLVILICAGFMLNLYFYSRKALPYYEEDIKETSANEQLPLHEVIFI